MSLKITLKQLVLYLTFFSATFHSMSQWTEEQKVTAQAPNFPFVLGESDFAGRAVSVDGDYALVGVPLSDIDASNSGMVLVYHWNGSEWEEETFSGCSDFPSLFRSIKFTD